MRLSHSSERKGNVLFNDALNTFYLRLYGVGHMVKYHSYSERGNLLPPHGLLFPINSKGSFIFQDCTLIKTLAGSLCFINMLDTCRNIIIFGKMAILCMYCYRE